VALKKKDTNSIQRKWMVHDVVMNSSLTNKEAEQSGVHPFTSLPTLLTEPPALEICMRIVLIRLDINNENQFTFISPL
jgi:hypothetical protein